MRRAEFPQIAPPAAGGAGDGSAAGPVARTGEREALGARLAAQEPRMTAVALRYVRDRDAAADVVQSAFEKVCRHQGSFRGESRLSTWVHRIVVNEALMWLRAEGRRSRGRVPAEAPDVLADAAPEPADPAPGALARLLDRERAQALRAALDALPAAEREVLERCALGDASYAGYGRSRGLHPAAVKSRAFRARRRLAAALEPA